MNWIKCTDRMPTEDGLYLVAYEEQTSIALKRGILMGSFWVGDPSLRFLFQVNVRRGLRFGVLDSTTAVITHWMPLPEFPRDI